MKRITTWLTIVCLVPYLTGCSSLTNGLWSSDLSTARREPTASPDVRVLEARDRKDYLVQYYEQRSNGAKRRSYWMYANDARIKKGKKPKFVDAHAADGLTLVPLEVSAIADIPGENGTIVTVPVSAQIAPFATNGAALYAVLLSDHRHFVLVAAGNELGTFGLPSYRASGTEMALYALTPVTVTGDVVCTVVVVGSVAGLIYLYVWEAGGQPNFNNK